MTVVPDPIVECFNVIEDISHAILLFKKQRFKYCFYQTVDFRSSLKAAHQILLLTSLINHVRIANNFLAHISKISK